MEMDHLNRIGKQIVEACLEVHKELGPGLLESAYVACLKIEFELRGLRAVREVSIPIIYKGYDTGKSYSADFIIEDEVILEAKSVESIIPRFEAQLLSHLKLTKKKLGYFVNFNVPLIRDGIKRMKNGY